MTCQWDTKRGITVCDQKQKGGTLLHDHFRLKHKEKSF